jgi:uncharacterized protein (TIGR02246 family)
MPPDLAPEDQAGLERIVNQLEAAWNGMDGSAFAAPFAGDADFVTIRGEHFRGRSAIGAGHAAIFRTIYGGSTVRFKVESARPLRPDVALLHVRSVLNAPSGPLAGGGPSRLDSSAYTAHKDADEVKLGELLPRTTSLITTHV